MRSKKSDLKKSIKEKEIQLAKLKEHVDKSNVCNDLYNKVVLEKAILKKELDDSNKNNFIENVKKFMPHRKKLISDYFKSN